MTAHDEQIIARARVEIPAHKRAERYASREPEKLRSDLNEQWDLVRALLRRIDDLESQARIDKVKMWFMMALLGGAATKGLELAAIAVIHAVTH